MSVFFFFSSRRRHTRFKCDWSSDVCSSDLPGQTISSLALCVSAAGLGGLALSAWVVVLARRQQSYAPVLSDWIWHVALPFVAYASLFAAAIALSRRPALSLGVVAASALLLLFIGIRNAWDIAVWIAAGGPQGRGRTSSCALTGARRDPATPTTGGARE